jgi:hypothetical protein
VLGYIESGVAEGAALRAGGQRWGDKGYFIQPTVFRYSSSNYFSVFKTFQMIVQNYLFMYEWMPQQQQCSVVFGAQLYFIVPTYAMFSGPQLCYTVWCPTVLYHIQLYIRVQGILYLASHFCNTSIHAMMFIVTSLMR